MKTSQNRTSLALMAIFFLMPGALIINPAIQTIADAYPAIPYTTVLLVSTLPLLIIGPMSLLSGALAGKHVKYKQLLVLGIFLFILGGSMPFVFREFSVVLAARVIYGIGAGILTPLANGMVILLYQGQKRADTMGLGSMVLNVASTLFMLLSGLICAIDFNYIWLLHMIGVVALVLILMYLPEPETIEEQAQRQQEEVKMPMSIFLISGAAILCYMNLSTVLLNMSSILTTEDIGNSATAGTVLALYTVGGIFGGSIFGKYFKFFGKFTTPSAIGLMGLGMGIIYFSKTLPLIILGSITAGVGYFILYPSMIMDASHRVTVVASAMVSAMVLSALNFGGFLSSLYIGGLSQIFSNTNPRFPIFIGMIVLFLLSTVWGAITIFGKSYANFATEG